MSDTGPSQGTPPTLFQKKVPRAPIYIYGERLNIGPDKAHERNFNQVKIIEKTTDILLIKRKSG